MSRFLALGNCTLDDVLTADGVIAPRQVGGNGVYAAVGMRVWGEDVALVSVVGEDFPREWLQRLADGGIDVVGVRMISEPHRLQSRVFYFPDGRRTDLVDEAQTILPAGAADLLDLQSEYPSTGSPLHRRLWPLFSPLPEQLPDELDDVVGAHLAPGALPNNRATAAALKERSGSQVTVTLDWPWWEWDHEGEADRALLRHIDYLLPSVEEAQIYARAVGKDTFSALRDLLRYGPRAAAIKMGAQGSRVLAHPEANWVTVPVYATEVVDPTGAGDAFCGGFLVGITRTGDPVLAALYGAVSASFIIEGFGPLRALDTPPTAAEVRLRRLQAQLGIQRTIVQGGISL